MPINEFRCINGHTRDVFVHHYKDKGSKTIICHCGHTMGSVFSVGSGLTWASEKKPRTIYNLGEKPVTVRTHAEHREAMRRAGVSEAGAKRGMKGSWV